MAKIGDYFLIDSNGFYIAETTEAWRYQPSEYVRIPYPTNGGNYRWDRISEHWVMCYPVDSNGIQIQTATPALAHAAPTIAPATKTVRWDSITGQWTDPRIAYDVVIDGQDIEWTWLDGVKIRDSYGVLSLDILKKDMIRNVNASFPQFFVQNNIRNLSVFGHDTSRNTFTAYTLDIPAPKYAEVSAALATAYGRNVSIEKFEGWKLDLGTLQVNTKYFDTLLENYAGYILPNGATFSYAALYDDPAFSPTTQEVYFTHPDMEAVRQWCINTGMSYSVEQFSLGAVTPERTQFSIYFDTVTKQPIKFKQYYRIPFYTYNSVKMLHLDPTMEANINSRLAEVDVFLAELGI